MNRYCDNDMNFSLPTVDARKYNSMIAGNYDASDDERIPVRNDRELAKIEKIMSGDFPVTLQRVDGRGVKSKHLFSWYKKFDEEVRNSNISPYSKFKDKEEKIGILKKMGISSLRGGLSIDSIPAGQVGAAFRDHYSRVQRVMGMVEQNKPNYVETQNITGKFEGYMGPEELVKACGEILSMLKSKKQ